MRKFIFSLTILIAPNLSFAGVFEFGLSGSYRQSTVDEYNRYDVKEIGASLSYYFWAQSAIELSYTARLTVKTVGQLSSHTEEQIEETFYGADFILSLADPRAAIRPYLKVGGVYIHKKDFYQTLGSDGSVSVANYVPFNDGWAPSAGAGIKIGLTETMSLKLGAETWSMTLANGQKQSDYAGRVGLSWLF
ncbi:MAG: hypothetical protein A4S09_15720 [Proteobacteria bacterium SG_bin7]|nr:MAG: hypothetical protein A4S09_15720 [Proteobacteria bacterium SG_bin7]